MKKFIALFVSVAVLIFGVTLGAVHANATVSASPTVSVAKGPSCGNGYGVTNRHCKTATPFIYFTTGTPIPLFPTSTSTSVPISPNTNTPVPISTSAPISTPMPISTSAPIPANTPMASPVALLPQTGGGAQAHP